MTIRVVVIRGNGYVCKCCRKQVKENHDFHSVDDAFEFIDTIDGLSRRRCVGQRYDLKIDKIIKTGVLESKQDEFVTKERCRLRGIKLVEEKC